MKLLNSIDFAGFVLRQSFFSFLRNKGLEKAAVLAYNSFFALFPLMLLLLFVAGRYMASSEVTMDAIEHVVSQLMPMFSDVIIREVEGLSTQKTWGGISMLLLLWAVIPLAGAIRGAFDQIYKRERPLPFLKEKLLDGLAVLLMLVMLVLLVAGEIAYAVVGSFIAGKMPLVLRMTDILLPVGVTVVLLSLIYYVFAPVRLRLTSVLTGGLVTAVLLGLMGPGFTAIMKFNPDYGYAFGSLKAVFLLLIWIYYSFVAILLGIEVAACIHWREAILVRELFLSPEKRHKYAERLRQYKQGYDENHILFKEGDPGDSMYYIISGSVQLTRGAHVLRVMREGEYFGEMAMLLKATRSADAVIGEEGTQLVTISSTNIEAMLRQNPAVVLALLQEMAQRLKNTDAMLPPS
jgi:YihY family inner membrane protein